MASANSPTLIFDLTPIPDFIEDHSLLSHDAGDRIREHCSRWTQFITGLWQWHEQASFCLRYVSGVIPGRVDVFLLARSKSPDSDHVLRNNLRLLLANHRLIVDMGKDDSHVKSYPLMALLAPEVIEVTQLAVDSLWKPKPTSGALPTSQSGGGWVIYPWWGPGGPFLLPLQALVSQSLPTVLSMYLEPTKLTEEECKWFKAAASESESLSDQSERGVFDIRTADPGAKLASRLYTANFRRLLANPFLVSVQCLVDSKAGAGGGQATVREKQAVAKTVGASIQALVHELPFDQSYHEDDHLPSGSTARLLKTESLRQHTELGFALATKSPLARLPYLVDAQGAATVFRLPVSVRGGVPGIEVRQLAPDFNPGPRSEEIPSDHIDLGKYNTGGRAAVRVAEFKKHALITGFTGSGKTNTVLYILDQLWRDHGIPFLVIESAKAEYRGLIRVSDRPNAKNNFQGTDANGNLNLRIYTLGNELCAPFRLNPFEVFPGIRLEAHIGRLQTCFAAAVPQEGPLPALIFDAIMLVYTDQQFGWRLTDVGPSDLTKDPRRFPRMSDFRDKILALIKTPPSKEFPKGRGYQGEILHNVMAYVSGRISPLLDGSKGRMFDVDRSIPPKQLFKFPTILELNDLNGPDKALVTMLLLMLLREYRESDKSSELVHVTVVEEAHNILSRSEGARGGSDQPDTAGQTVTAFSNMLSEIRALGEGLIIADQSPEKLAKDAMRNTNVQIAHQLRDSDDRNAIANAMLMSDEQRDFVGKLRTGWAAVFFQGLEKATFVKVPNYEKIDEEDSQSGRGASFDKYLDEDDVRTHMHELTKDAMVGPLGKRCEPCQHKCQYRQLVLATTRDDDREWFESWQKDFNAVFEPGANSSESEKQSVYESLAIFLTAFSKRNEIMATDDSCWCVIQHLCQTKWGDTGLEAAGTYNQVRLFLGWARRQNSK